MKRRNFLTKGTISLPAVFGGMTAGLPIDLFGKDKKDNSFSISILTESPAEFVREIEESLKLSEFRNIVISYKEHQLYGEFLADIAYIKSGSLIDFYSASDKLSERLIRAAKLHSFPRKVIDPALIVFSSGGGGDSKSFNVSVGNELVNRIPVKAKNGMYRIKGAEGFVDLEIEDKSARIHSSSCKHKTCVEMGEIKNPGENLVCIPNKIIISVSGKSVSLIDSITY